ncbi:hypothetical protein [Robertmurraya massiliosenegalensis]|uniref:hypothetical protein n=1 Tax=Robertmurraya massiliosenegalensis TaxID=1287657 RepID=UPI0002EAE76A|nr:hypothetical protein [Robertmurraya massiliosenegalensis]
MNCCCEKGEWTKLKIEGDVGADPFWCEQCGCNIDIEALPLSDDLIKRLISWSHSYGEWIDWNTDRLVENGLELEDVFNQVGKTLTEKVKQEIGNTFHIKFVPSTSAKLYAGSK